MYYNSCLFDLFCLLLILVQYLAAFCQISLETYWLQKQVYYHLFLLTLFLCLFIFLLFYAKVKKGYRVEDDNTRVSYSPHIGVVYEELKMCIKWTSPLVIPPKAYISFLPFDVMLEKIKFLRIQRFCLWTHAWGPPQWNAKIHHTFLKELQIISQGPRQKLVWLHKNSCIYPTDKLFNVLQGRKEKKNTNKVFGPEEGVLLCVELQSRIQALIHTQNPVN